MKIHRFYTPDIDLDHDLWLKTPELLHQWNKVLRFRAGQQVVLFDGVEQDRLYEIASLTSSEAELKYITDYKRQLPKKDVYLFWSLLKKDKNDWVLQKCTELGVSHFVPLLADRSEKTGFNTERAQKIVIEAAEQCGRSNIPGIREPIKVETALKQFTGKFPLLVCEQGTSESSGDFKEFGVLLGPEGGWTEQEKEHFKAFNCQTIRIHDFTLRAETAAVASIAILC